jgi:hypothetical protein
MPVGENCGVDAWLRDARDAIAAVAGLSAASYPDITPSTTRLSTLRPHGSLNILAALDGSLSSRRALERVMDIARAIENSKLTLVTVSPPLSHYVTLSGVSSCSARVAAGEHRRGYWAA